MFTSPRICLRDRVATGVIGMLALFLVVIVAGCSGGSSSKRSGPEAGGADALGARVYARSCASCHGTDLRGTSKGPSQLSQVYEPGHHPDASYRSAIENGVAAHHWNFGDMPPVTGLDEAEIDAVIAYIRSQQATHGFEAYPPN